MQRLHRPPSVRPVTSPAGVRRLLVDLDPADLRRYRAFVLAAWPAIDRALGPDVFTDRTCGRDVRASRAAWRRALRRVVAEPGRFVVGADVRRCYRSIGPRAVEAGLRRAGVGERARLLGMIAAVDAAGIEGLPVGPEPSGVLANAVLAIADDAVRAEGARCLRWVDDVVIVGDAHRVRRAAAAWRASLAEIGLDEHPGKHLEGPAGLVLPGTGTRSAWGSVP